MSEKYDVFLSHNSADKPAVELLASRLSEEAGLKPFLDKWHLVPGEPWQKALEDALHDSSTVAVFIGPEGVSPWHNEELRVAINRAVRTRDEYRVIPVLLPGADPESVTSFLELRTWVDFSSGLDDQQAFKRLIAGVKGEAILGGTYKLPDEPAPYRALLRFEADQAKFFFGRETETRDLVKKVEHNPFVALIGASGSGKSSLVRAGLLPALAEDAIKGSKTWQTRLVIPGSDPLHALAVGLCAGLPRIERSQIADQINESMLNREDGLRTEVAALFANKDGQTPTVLLIIDQFEEIFTQCKDSAERCQQQIDAFVANLSDAVVNSGGSIRFLITLRADFLGHCLELPALMGLLQNQQMLLGPLTEDGLRDAITGPAQVVGVFFEKGLVSAILRDVKGNPGALPLLQVALDDLWQARQGPWLTLDAYEASEGVDGALQRRAQSTYDSLSPDQQNIARNIFLRMTALSAGVSNTRRRVSIEELYLAGTERSDIDKVLATLSGPQARLIVTGEDFSAEMAHEALINGWPLLHTWLETDKAGLLLHRALTQDAEKWLALEKDSGALYRGVQLEKAWEWSEENAAALNPLEQEFLSASQENALEEQKQAKRLVRGRRMQAILSGATVLLMVGLVVVLLQVFYRVFSAKEMGGSFNVAVADFNQIAADGEVQTSETGQQISKWTVEILLDVMGDLPNLEIWPTGGPLTRTTVGMVSNAEEAAATAKKINADLILYGNIDTSQSPPQLVLRFWIQPIEGYQFNELPGSYTVSKPIRITNLNNPAASVRSRLENQASAIAWIARGLSQGQLGEPEFALEEFQRAAEADPQSAIVQFFIGRENLFLSDRYPERLKEAEAAYNRAIELDPQYARAHIGLGSLYLDRAAEWIDAALNSGQPVDPQADDWAGQAVNEYQLALDLNPSAEEYGNPVMEVARLGLGSAYRYQGVIDAIQGDTDTALATLEKAIETLENTKTFFKTESAGTSGLLRYLVQNYEYLGATYHWQGAVYELIYDTPSAQNAYRHAMENFHDCDANADRTYDLLILDEVIGYCQKYAGEVQTRIDHLTGEK